MSRDEYGDAVGRWHVSFELDGEDWEWVGIEAPHPAGAKKLVHKEYGERITAYGYVTPTDTKQSIETLNQIRSGRAVAEGLRAIVRGILG